MRRFSLRHLFLLMSMLCLWFGAYAFWRDLVVFVGPLFVGIASFIVCTVRSAKVPAKRLVWVVVFTLANFLCGLVGGGISVDRIRSPLKITAFVFVAIIFLQGCYLGIQAVKCVSTLSFKQVVLGIALSVLNLLTVGALFQILRKTAHFL